MSHATASRQPTCVITRLERRTNSPSGNPRYLVHLEGYPAPLKTADDIADAYGITAFDEGGRKHGQPVALTLDARGDIVRISG